MLRLLSDENFNGHVVSGLILKRPEMDLVRVQDVGLQGAKDPEVLRWAAQENRIVLTHDLESFRGYVYARLVKTLPVSGVFIFRDQHAIGSTIEWIEMLNDCSEPEEWRDRAVI